MQIQSLNSSSAHEWQFQKYPSDSMYDATVPGCVHTDLLNSGVIPDPFSGVNEVRVAWVAESDWVYRLEFDTELAGCEHLFLECDGLDTISEIRLNSIDIAKTDNMFRRYRFNVSDAIKSSGNVLEIKFKSPVNTVKAMKTDDNVTTPGDSIDGSPYIRKAMYQWGWDWAPKIPTSGIWKDIRLTGYDSARIADTRITQNHHEGCVELTIDADIERFIESKLNLSVTVTAPNGEKQTAAAEVDPSVSSVCLTARIDDPLLWWPNGYGSQPLYDVNIELAESGSEIDSLSKKIGLRTIELVQQPDEWGKSFYFTVNGVPIFAKGGDWVPADQFPSRIDSGRYEILIRDAASANMNMLRVWGGGLYESDDFYDHCDKYGILAWQDFMFACAHYPVDADYLENVRFEAIDNIRRIRHHASLALWCGNNEMEWFLAGNFGGEKNLTMRDEYLRIFYKLLPEVHTAEDPSTPYWPASPASSIPFDDPNGENEGDGHYWDVWHGRLPFTAYRKHYYRLMSEFGFESMPAYETIKAFAEPVDMNMTSLVMENHQKNSAGNGLILYYMAQTYQFPKDFKSMVYVSQLLQAEAMRYGVEHWRRNRNGYRCMGTLYWQYNDCWPVASWASIDYFNRWKALQYFAKRFYKPVLLSVEENATGAKIHITNDKTVPFKGLVRWSLESFSGKILVQGDAEADVPAGCDMLIAEPNIAEHLNYDSRRQLVLVYQLYSGFERISMGIATFAPSKHLELPDAEIAANVSEKDGKIAISITTDKTVRYVMLDISGHDVLFSDNYFDLPANRTVEIFVETDGIAADTVRNRLLITHLKESY